MNCDIVYDNWNRVNEQQTEFSQWAALWQWWHASMKIAHSIIVQLDWSIVVRFHSMMICILNWMRWKSETVFNRISSMLLPSFFFSHLSIILVRFLLFKMLFSCSSSKIEALRQWHHTFNMKCILWQLDQCLSICFLFKMMIMIVREIQVCTLYWQCVHLTAIYEDYLSY